MPTLDLTTSEHLASEHLASEHLASEHLASEHLASEHLASEHLASEHLASEQITEQVADTSEQMAEASEHSTGNDSVTNAAAPSFPARPKFLMLPLDKISPSPLNPRKRFDPAALDELAASIRAHDVQQPIVVRQHNESRGALGGNTVSYSIVMGERRWRAARLAGLGAIPAIVRADLTDLAHAELALEENVRRRDLSPMEEVRGLAQLIALGRTQAEVGGAVGVKQARVSSLLSLLELPDDVQQMIDAGELSRGHGIVLARYKAWPDVVRHLAARIVHLKVPVSRAEKGLYEIGIGEIGINGIGIRSDGDKTFLLELSGYPRPAFDWKAVCPSCAFGAYHEEGDSQRGEHSYCMRPAHAAKLEKEAKDAAKSVALAEADERRRQAVERGREAEAQVQAATTKAARASAQSEAESARKALAAIPEGDAPKLSKCERDVIEELDRYSPAGCQAGACPCRVMAVERYGNDIVPACADPKRLAKLKAAQTKDTNVDRKAVFAAQRAQIEALPWDGSAGEAAGRRMMTVVAWSFLRGCKGQAKKEVAARLPEDGAGGAVRGVLLQAGYAVKDLDAYAALSGLDTTALLCLTAEVLLRDDLIERYDYGDDKAPRTAWFLDGGQAPAPEATPQTGPPTPRAAPDLPAEGTHVSTPGKHGPTDEDRARWAAKREADTQDAGLIRALHHVTGADERLQEMRESGVSDRDLKIALGEMLDDGGSSGPGQKSINHRGGISPAFWFDCGRGINEPPTLKGVALVAEVRRVMNLPYPAPAVPDVPTEGEKNGTSEGYADGADMACAGCGGPVTDGAFDEAGARPWFEGQAVRMSSGELAVRGRAWCDQCGPQIGDGGEPRETAADKSEPPDVNNEAPLCGCGEPICMGTCYNNSPSDWEYPAPEGRIEIGRTEVDPSDMDAKFCRSCGVLPVAGSGLYCPGCDPLTGEEDARVTHAICNL